MIKKYLAQNLGMGRFRKFWRGMVARVLLYGGLKMQYP
jgi:hypothetical protein